MNSTHRTIAQRNWGAWTVVVALTIGGHVAAGEPDLPWVFNAPRADGYAIDLVSIEPAPGTPLVRGETVTFKATVAYSLTIAPKGEVVLVFQDEKNRSATTGQTPVSAEAAHGEGRMTLTQAVVVPAKAKELRLFIPLVPDGIDSTTGEVTVRYPIVKMAPPAAN